MKNITLSADEHLIAAARERAKDRNTTLNAEFRLWLASYAATAEESDRRRRAYEDLMASLAGVRSGGRFTRDEMNECGGG